MYSLRLYKTDPSGSFHSNTHVKDFELINGISVCRQVDVSKFDPVLSMFQVYPPTNKDRTFYEFKEGNGLYVYFRSTENGQYHLKCSTHEKDNYLYFKPSTDGGDVFVVEAVSATAAFDLLLLLSL